MSLLSLGKKYKTPIHVIDPNDFDDVLLDHIEQMDRYTPHTSLRAGDLCTLKKTTPQLLFKNRLLPRMWQIRFVISAWAFELMCILHEANHSVGPDEALNRLEMKTRMRPNEYRRPLIYAHGFPHGMYPDTAEWFELQHLQKTCLIAPTEEWPTVLDAAKARYRGYDRQAFTSNITLPVAPDHYKKGENIGRPFDYEHGAVHSVALMGLEQVVFQAADPYEINRGVWVDREHDLYRP